MLQSLAALFGGAFTIAACYSAGVLLIARAMRGIGMPLHRFEYIPLAFITGAPIIQLFVFATLVTHTGYRAVWIAAFALLLWTASKIPLPKPGPALSRPLAIGFGIIFAIFTALYFVNAWAPETSPDGASYHLEFVARFVRAHRFVWLPDDMYAALSEGIEMLYVPAFALGRHSGAALVHFGFLVALAMLIFAYGRRIAKPWAGAAAALLVYLSPVVGRDGTTAYIDVAVAAIAFAVFYWLEIWDQRRTAAMLIPIGLLAGYGYAAKYTAFVLVIYALGFLAWRARKWQPVAIAAAFATLTIAPWMIKDWIQYQNPVAPMANQIFRNPYIHVWTEQDWSSWLRRYDIPSLWMLPKEVTVKGSYVQGLIGPVFLLLPIALLALRHRTGRRLLVPGFLFLAVYFTNIGARFLIPCLPFFALAMALAINVRVLLAAVVLFHAFESMPFRITHYSNPNVWRIQDFPLRAALRLTSQEAYLRKTLYADDVVRMVESNVPPHGRVFSSQGFATSYTTRDILIGYESAFSTLIGDMIFMGFTEDFQPTKAAVMHFPETSVRRIRVLQTAHAKSGDMWDVHEMRFYSRGAEIPRDQRWKLRAWPNAWDVQLAFDNSEATRWRTWETAAPGDYLDVDFGAPTPVDQVILETSNQSTWPMHLEVQALDPSGHWRTLTDVLDIQQRAVRGSIRRQATYEMHRRGVDYLLEFDSAWGASDFSDDPAAWGLEVAARSSQATLYKVIP